MSFPCTCCGVCCKNIAGIEELKDFDLGNGVCKFLNEKTKQCDIYEQRPKICKIDEMFDFHYSKYFSKEQFYLINIKSCNLLQEKENIDESFRIK